MIGEREIYFDGLSGGVRGGGSRGVGWGCDAMRWDEMGWIEMGFMINNLEGRSLMCLPKQGIEWAAHAIIIVDKVGRPANSVSVPNRNNFEHPNAITKPVDAIALNTSLPKYP